jgi:hypothetical protein
MDERVGALDAALQSCRSRVPVLGQRADAEGVSRIRSIGDMVPLLFPHTTYKSYPEALIGKGQWAQMNRWLDSLSTHRVDNVELSGIVDVDGWIERLEAAGHLVTTSSGTSGKSSFLNKSQCDRDASMDDMITCLTSLGLTPSSTWHVIPIAPETGQSHHRALRDLIVRSFHRPDGIAIETGPPPTGHHRYMTRLVTIRKAMAAGTASPDDVASFEAETAHRQADSESRLRYFAAQILEHRDEQFFFQAMFPLLYRLCEVLQEMGAKVGDITGANALSTGGGIKGVALPSDYQERIFRMLNIEPGRFLHYYSMQELNIRMPKCREGRYHVPPALVLLVLDEHGETLAPASDGQVEGRAAFFDFTVDGRWGGTISGDKIRADLATCRCGRTGPTISAEITRYANLPDGDKITCAGTVDAYVRGFIED